MSTTTAPVQIDLTEEELAGDVRERHIIELPTTYNDLRARPALLKRLRERFGDGDWQVEKMVTDGDKLLITVVNGLPLARPDAAAWRLSDAPGPRGAGTLDTLAQDASGFGGGASVVQYDWDARRAVVAALPPATREVRDVLARALRVDPWQLEVSVAFSAETGRPALIHVWRGASLVRTDSKGERNRARHQAWLSVVRDIWPPQGDDVWSVSYDDAAHDKIALSCTADPLAGILEYPWDETVDYKSLPFGMDPDGNLVTMGLLEVNHLLGGTPGGGKSGGITALLAGIARLDHVAIVGLDPKRVEQGMWAPRFSRIATGNGDDPSLVLEALEEEMERRYDYLQAQGLKKFTPKEFSAEWPLIVVVIDELADLVAVAADKDGKAEEATRSTLIRRLIALGRAAGIVLITATQKPQSDVVPTALRDLIQLRVAYATTNAAMTDTILGAGMAGNGADSHEIPASLRGVCYYVNETSREPLRARTFWIPDEDVPGIAERYAHLRVELPWMPEPGTPRRGQDADNGDAGGFKPDLSGKGKGKKTFSFAAPKPEPVDEPAEPVQDAWLQATPAWDFAEEPPPEEAR